MSLKKNFLFVILFVLEFSVLAQTKVSITIDDVPNTKKYEKNHFQTKLLDCLDSLQIPVAIFINEGMLYKNQLVSRNFDLLNQWIKRDYITLGNHTFKHSRYSEVGYDAFVTDIIKGEAITKELAKLNHKESKYFRFPYNDLGKDSLQRHKMEQFLKVKAYVSTPFTIESSDWMFNYLYEYYLQENKKNEAERIAISYVNTTLAYFQYFDSLSMKQYGRHIHQVYLCHDNSLNADYLKLIVSKLKEKNYSFISLDELMKDQVYQQKNNYHKKWGISWFYRWMTNKSEIKKLMQNEPDIMNIYQEYQRIQKVRSQKN